MDPTASLLPFKEGPVYDLDFEGIGYRSKTLAELRAASIPEAVLLDRVKDRLKAAVDARAESARGEIATPGSGQAMEYQEAQAQAAAALKAPSSASADKYPMLAATIGVDVDPSTSAPATDVLGVARSIDAARTLWLQAGAAIRGARLGGKAAIEAATTIAEAEAALAAIAWPALA